MESLRTYVCADVFNKFLCVNDQAYNCILHLASCILTYNVMIHAVMTYDIMTHDVMKYDAMTYYIMPYDFMTYNVMTYEIMKNDVMKKTS